MDKAARFRHFAADFVRYRESRHGCDLRYFDFSGCLGRTERYEYRALGLRRLLGLIGPLHPDDEILEGQGPERACDQIVEELDDAVFRQVAADGDGHDQHGVDEQKCQQYDSADEFADTHGQSGHESLRQI